jgi:hypothetical protein
VREGAAEKSAAVISAGHYVPLFLENELSMIMPSDKEYKETKQIMLGKKSIKPEFRELADWIDNEFDVKTINIIYDTIDNGQRPRLQICFEFERERSKFTNREKGRFDIDKQKAIADKFKETLLDNDIIQKKSFIDFFRNSTVSKYMTEDMWVIYGAFEPIARIEANESIPQSKIQALKTNLSNVDVWEISRAFSGVTFFLFTDTQVKQYENTSITKDWTNKYFDILEQYNEFGYFKRENFSIYLDSKENFDKNYESNWFYYYK